MSDIRIILTYNEEGRLMHSWSSLHYPPFPSPGDDRRRALLLALWFERHFEDQRSMDGIAALHQWLRLEAYTRLPLAKLSEHRDALVKTRAVPSNFTSLWMSTTTLINQLIELTKYWTVNNEQFTHLFLETLVKPVPYHVINDLRFAKNVMNSRGTIQLPDDGVMVDKNEGISTDIIYLLRSYHYQSPIIFLPDDGSEKMREARELIVLYAQEAARRGVAPRPYDWVR